MRELKRQGQSKSKATETVKKNKREPGARSAKKQKEAIASGQDTAKVAELIKRPKEYTVQISFPEVAELSRPVMEVNRVFFRYSEKHPVIFDELDFGIDMDSRICVVGPVSCIYFLITLDFEMNNFHCTNHLMICALHCGFTPIYKERGRKINIVEASHWGNPSREGRS